VLLLAIATKSDEESSMKLILSGLKSTDRVFRCASALTLPKRKCSPEAVVKLTYALTEDSDAEVRACAAFAIGEMGAEARKALPVLQKVAERDTGLDSANASAAIKKIENDQKKVEK
jgi:HEAT repeat protein